MNNPKNTSFAIGAFLVGALALVFSALLFFSSGQFFSKKERVVMYFEGSVQGLQIGAPVKLKGVAMGDIIDIQLDIDKENTKVMTVVTADLVLERISQKGNHIDEDFLAQSINNGLRAQLNYMSLLTGLLYVELDFYPNKEATFYNPQNKHIEIPVVARDLEKITQNIQNINFEQLMNNIDSLIFQINKIASSGRIEQTLNDISEAAQSVNKTTQSLDPEIKQLSKNINNTSVQLSQLLETLNREAPEMSKQLNTNLVTLQKSLDQFNQTARTLNHSLSDDAPLVNQLNTTLQDVSASARAFRALSETLEQQPEAIWRGKSINEVEK